MLLTVRAFILAGYGMVRSLPLNLMTKFYHSEFRSVLELTCVSYKQVAAMCEEYASHLKPLLLPIHEIRMLCKEQSKLTLLSHFRVQNPEIEVPRGEITHRSSILDFRILLT